LFTLSARARNTLWKIAVTGGNPVQLTSSGIAIKPVVSPDGSRIACTYRSDEADNWKEEMWS
jgi:Tol biopolymer transport system component